jgi:hypothetical protein
LNRTVCGEIFNVRIGKDFGLKNSEFYQAFVEGLLRLANVLEATNGTLKNVNNICTLAIDSVKYFALFFGDLTGIR